MENWWKTFDGIAGDITILADRWERVKFTEPYTESGLSMMVWVKPQIPKPWMFLVPFTKEMWGATGAILIYTMSIVWFIEHRSNPEFSGPWKDQLGNALWFTFSSLFFAHREKIQRNYTRVVIVVWLFVVLVLTQSYTASLTSMLTVSRLPPPNVKDIEWLKRTNATVGCDGNTFVKKYLESVLGFNTTYIMSIDKKEDYLSAFMNGTISAAFLEVPYAKVFANKHCKQCFVTGSAYRFGGFGFVFQNDSPRAVDFSRAILKLSEKGKLREFEDNLFGSFSECSNSQTIRNNDSLSLESFWGLYVVSGATSTICFLLFIIHLLKNYRCLRH